MYVSMCVYIKPKSADSKQLVKYVIEKGVKSRGISFVTFLVWPVSSDYVSVLIRFASDDFCDKNMTPGTFLFKIPILFEHTTLSIIYPNMKSIMKNLM